MTVHREQSMKRKKPTRCNNSMFIINFCLNMFRASLCPSSGEQRSCYYILCILVRFCWMWLVAVVGHCLVGCDHYEVYCSTLEQKPSQCSHPTRQRPHNRYQPHPAEPEQYTKCSSRTFVLLKMGIMMSETC